MIFVFSVEYVREPVVTKGCYPWRKVGVPYSTHWLGRATPPLGLEDVLFFRFLDSKSKVGHRKELGQLGVELKALGQMCPDWTP